nr:FHA domain-containing protein [Pseudarthrobacter oxydans]
MPVEDFRFAQQFGIAEFARQLADYRHKYALKQGWYPPGEDPVPVAVWPDESRKRLRPELSYEVARDGLTRTITTEGNPVDDISRTEPLNGLAWITFQGKEWTLRPREAPYRLGRGEENQIRTIHETISARHAVIRYSRDSWVLEPLERTTNPTRVDGQKITGPTPLSSGSIIRIGDADPIRFDEGAAVIGDSTATDRRG